MEMNKTILISFFLFLTFLLNAQKNANNKPSIDFSHGKLKVSANGHFLVFEDETPFFYLGDTAWKLFHRLNKSDAEMYLENRRQKGYTVIQAVVLSGMDGFKEPNANGDLPVFNNDPLQPNEKYYVHVDWIIAKAQEKGIFIALLPTWGDKVDSKILNMENMFNFGKWIAERYKSYTNIIWVNGGDRAGTLETNPIWEELAKGILSVDKNHLMTFHPNGRNGSSDWFHNADWLDFNMRQNGHVAEYNVSYLNTAKDYQLIPAKPVIDGEPIYEDIGLGFDPTKNGHAIASDVRRPLYWNLFSGAFGHTYENNSVWQMWTPDKEGAFDPLMPWNEAINQAGADQMQYGRWLMESRPFVTRIPDDAIIIPNKITNLVPGTGCYRFVATRDIDGTYAMIYAPIGCPFSVNMTVIKGAKVKAWWFNPRNGEATAIGVFANSGAKEFISPTRGENTDWILVLDDASKKYPKPGKH